MSQSGVSSPPTRPVLPSPAERRFLLIAGTLTAVAVLLQGYLTIRLCLSRGWGLPGAVFKLLSYFTVLTNILLAASWLIQALRPLSPAGSFFRRADVRSALLLYIGTVGCVYVTILTHLWNPQGLQWLADVLLHYVTPLLYLLYWLVFVPGARIPWRAGFKWVLYPMGYLLFSLVRGALTGDYPYPFIDLTRLSGPQAAFNVIVLTLAFLGAAQLVIFICRCRAGTTGKE